MIWKRFFSWRCLTVCDALFSFVEHRNEWLDRWGVIVLIGESDCLRLNSFANRYLHCSLKHDPSSFSSTFPTRFVNADEQIFVNWSFRLIFHFGHFHPNGQWKNEEESISETHCHFLSSKWEMSSEWRKEYSGDALIDESLSVSEL